MSDVQTFELGDLALQSGMTLKQARLVYKTYGKLADDKRNVIVYPTSYGAHHSDIEWLIAKDKILDPEKYFIVIPNMFTNGLSSSPSTTPFPYDFGRFPLVTAFDNVQAQHRLITEVFGVERIAMVYGWSMGAQQAFHWGALFPDMVERICAVCGSARTAAHNKIFLEGVKSALTADSAYRDGWFWERPTRGLRAMARVYAGWAVSQTFYRDELWRQLGFASVEDFLVAGWEGNFGRRDANDLLAQMNTWTHGDISANAQYGGDFDAALGAIGARAIVMPCDTDLYFQVADNELEVAKMPNAELRVIRSDWGHRAGNPLANPVDSDFVRDAVRELLG
ncbi:MAG: alpha/beta fold hydrolase [Gammaproteobacteria bacterium]|nr:alpha/beta fold hydrolase [Gammaproteobacteria bacterium]